MIRVIKAIRNLIAELISSREPTMFTETFDGSAFELGEYVEVWSVFGKETEGVIENVAYLPEFDEYVYKIDTATTYYYEEMLFRIEEVVKVKGDEGRAKAKVKRDKIDVLLDGLGDYRRLADEFGDEEYKAKSEYITLKLAEITEDSELKQIAT